MKIIGVDMGGTKNHAALVSDYKVVSEIVMDSLSSEPEQVVIDRLIETIEKVYQPGCQGIGIGVPSVVDARSGIVYDVTFIPSWKEVHLKTILEDHFKIPVYVNNDANCFALGEKYFGKGQNVSDFVAVALGTGLGAGIIIHNKLYGGVNTGAGEVGTIAYKDGTIEDYCAGNFFKSLGKTGAEVYQAAVKGDREALGIFEVYGAHLSEVVKIILYAYDPEMIILGGSITNAYPYFIDAVWKGIRNFAFPVALRTLKIEKSELRNSAILGAAALVYNQE
jgi:glucokinase